MIYVTEFIATYISQVILNLMKNAIDAIGTDGAIEIKCLRSTDFDIVEISDTGPGMALNIVEKIFDPFFTTKAPGKGTGLGLSISMEIIKNHRGSISVESQPGKGTTFAVKFLRVS